MYESEQIIQNITILYYALAYVQEFDELETTLTIKCVKVNFKVNATQHDTTIIAQSDKSTTNTSTTNSITLYPPLLFEVQLRMED